MNKKHSIYLRGKTKYQKGTLCVWVLFPALTYQYGTALNSEAGSKSRLRLETIPTVLDGSMRKPIAGSMAHQSVPTLDSAARMNSQRLTHHVNVHAARQSRPLGGLLDHRCQPLDALDGRKTRVYLHSSFCDNNYIQKA